MGAVKIITRSNCFSCSLYVFKNFVLINLFMSFQNSRQEKLSEIPSESQNDVAYRIINSPIVMSCSPGQKLDTNGRCRTNYFIKKKQKKAQKVESSIH